MTDLSKKEPIFQVWNYYGVIITALASVGITLFVSTAWRNVFTEKGGFFGRLGLPFLGKTISFLSATNSTRGCYDFVRLRRQSSLILLQVYDRNGFFSTENPSCSYASLVMVLFSLQWHQTLA